MGRLHKVDPRTLSTSQFSPSYTSQSLALSEMGGPHPSATQTVQPINVAGEIADTPYRGTPPSHSARGSGSRCRSLPELSQTSGSSSSSSSSSAENPTQYSPPTSSGHAQAQGLHMGMARAQPHRTQPVRLGPPPPFTVSLERLELISVETSTSDGPGSATGGGGHT